jgi:hypothetical protein
MKKIISILLFAFAIASVSAQYTTPRTGTGANNDNTFRAATFSYTAVTDAAGIDTVSYKLSAYSNRIKVTLTDTLAINLTPVTKCYYGDLLTISVANSSGAGALKLIGSNVETADGSSARLYVTSAKRANIVLFFDGAKWVEQSRLVQ